MGFGVPIDRWFRGELKDELRAVLLDPVCLGRGPVPARGGRATSSTSTSTAAATTRYRLWALLMLELWFRRHLDTSRT